METGAHANVHDTNHATKCQDRPNETVAWPRRTDGQKKPPAAAAAAAADGGGCLPRLVKWIARGNVKLSLGGWWVNRFGVVPVVCCCRRVQWGYRRCNMCTATRRRRRCARLYALQRTTRALYRRITCVIVTVRRIPTTRKMRAYEEDLRHR